MRNGKSYIWGFVNQFLPQSIYLITNILLAHFLTPQDFGKVGVLSVIIAISTTLTDSGLGGSLVKEQKVTDQDCSTVFTFNLLVSVILYIVVFIFAADIEKFYNIKGLAIITRLLSIVFVINALSLVQKSLMIKELQFKRLALISISSMTFAAISAVIACLLNAGVYALVTFQIANVTCATIMLLLYSRRIFPLNFFRLSFKKLISFGVFTTICGLIDSVYENILSIFFGKFVSLRAVGFYDQAKKLETGSAYAIASTVNTVSFPVLSKISKDFRVFKEEAYSIQRMCFFVFIPAIITVSIYSERIIIVLYGEKWIGASSYLLLLMINGAIYLGETLIRNNIKSLGYVKQLASVTLIKRIIGIMILSVCLIINKDSLLYGLLFSTFVGLIMNAQLYCRLVNERIIVYLYNTIKMLAIPGIIVAIIYLISFLLGQTYFSLSLSIITLFVYYLIIGPRLKKKSE